jgi:succinate dehydrogenase / fumarate reductase cytochrome b subunit
MNRVEAGMGWLLSLWRSTVGKKAIMAVTGVIGIGFVFVHMVGNLITYAGPEALNKYAAGLKSIPPLLWGTRITLLVAVVVHLVCWVQLGLLGLRARPQGYAKPGNIQADVSSLTMRWTGPILALFLAFHLSHLTWGLMQPGYSHTDVYANVVLGFSQWWVSGFYVVCVAALGFHLLHGSWSFLNSLGLSHPTYNLALRFLGTAVVAVVVLGNISLPVAVLAGVIK